MLEVAIGLDMGTTRVKGGAFDAGGTLLASSGLSAPPLSDWRGLLSFDADRYLLRVVQVLSAVAGDLPDDAVPVALSLSSQRATVVPLAEGSEGLPAISWQDTNGADDLSRVCAGMGEGRFRSVTGLPPSALWSVSKILAVRRALEEEGGRPVRGMMLLHDSVLEGLGADRAVTDPSSASLTGLFDVRGLEWSGELLEAAGLDRVMLPDVLPAGTVCGTLDRGIASAAGLPDDLPLVVGGGDQQCAALGMGCSERGEAALCLGTAAVLSCPVEEPVTDGGGFFCTAHVVPGRWVIEGIQNSFASSLDWAGALLGHPEPAVREELALGAPRGASGVRFLPFLAGIGSPDYDDRTFGAFMGIRGSTGSAELLRAVYEGVLLESRRVLDAAGRAVPIERLVLGGGPTTGSATGLMAEVLGRGIQVSGRTQASLTGAAALAWRGAGRFGSVPEAGEEMSRSGLTDVMPEDSSVYDCAYADYLRLVGALRSCRRGRGVGSG